MSRENVELVREAFDAYNREGIDGILRFLDPDVEWRNPADSPIAGVFIGHQASVNGSVMPTRRSRGCNSSQNGSTSFLTAESSLSLVSGFAHAPATWTRRWPLHT